MEYIIDKLMCWIFKRLKINIKETTYRAILQFVEFGIVGLSNTIVYYIVNIITMLMIRPLFPSVDYVFGNIFGFIISVLWSFYWNNKFVFKKENAEKRNIWIALVKTFGAYSFTGIILSNIVSYVMIDIFSISKYIVPLVNSLIGVPINFILNKFWAFKK